MKLKTNDNIIVLAGKDKGKEGKIVKIFRKENKAIVKDVQIVKKHIKATKNEKGGIIEIPTAIDISNLAIIDPKTKKASRVSFEFDKNGKKIRISKKSGEKI